jgi:hypothetical protein
LLLTTIAALTLSAAIAVVPAAAQTGPTIPADSTAATPPDDIPSVGVTPTESHPDDPNKGGWFVFSSEPGWTAETEARIGNPATIPQKVTLYLADLVFGKDGTPTIPNGKPTDVGAWGAFDTPEVVIPPQQFVRVKFHLTVPAGADPGDHVGAVVAESVAQGGAIKVVKRVATRLYVLLPGNAVKALSITKVTKKLSSPWWPKSLEVTSLVTNTGRARLLPDVRINGVKAKGPELLLARSVEAYTAKVKVPWYGGPVTAHVRVESEAGTKTVAVSLFVIPWGSLAMLPVLVALGFCLRALNRMRTRRVRRLQADLRRLEGMVVERPTGEAAAMAALAEQHETLAAAQPEVPPQTETQDETPQGQEQIRSLREAFKRAQRTGSQTLLENVSLTLHAAGVDARADLLEALERSSGERRAQIEAALASYDTDPATSAPPVDVEPAPEPEQEHEPEPEPEHEPQHRAPQEPERELFMAQLYSAFDDEDW